MVSCRLRRTEKQQYTIRNNFPEHSQRRTMNVIGKIKERVSRIRTNLTSLDAQPISKAALVVILFLDIFILTSVFNGLDEHTRQLPAPDDYIPYSCRDIV